MKTIIYFMLFLSLTAFSQNKDSLKDFRFFYNEKTSFQDFIVAFDTSFKVEAEK